MEITSQQDYNKSATKTQQSWTCCELVVEIKNFLSRSTTFATCPQHVHNGLRIWKRLYVMCKTPRQPLQHVHNKLTIDIQQTNCDTHNKARIPAYHTRDSHPEGDGGSGRRPLPPDHLTF